MRACVCICCDSADASTSSFLLPSAGCRDPAARRHADSINPRADSAKSHLFYHQDVKYTWETQELLIGPVFTEEAANPADI